MKHTALLIIDVQNELFRRKTPVHRADELLANICYLAEQAHQNGAPVIYIQHNNNTMPQSSEGWKLHPRLKLVDDDIFLQKQHSSAFENTGLSDILATMDINDLIITGLVTHGCVKATCLDAIKIGIGVTLVSDGHSNFNRNPAAIITETHTKLIEAGIMLKLTREISFSGTNVA